MNKETKELVRYRLTRAKDTLKDARILFENDRLFSTVNRLLFNVLRGQRFIVNQRVELF